MAFHSDKTATFVVPVQPDQPPSGTAAWLREMARGSNSVNGGLVAEQQARIAGDNFLQSEIDGITGGTGVVGPPGPTGPAGPAGAPGATGPQGPNIVTADTPPASPAVGSGWWDSVGGQLYIWFVDPTGPGQWVPSANQPGPPGAAGAIGPAGPTGATGAASTVPGPAGPTGPTGATGPSGPAGSANMSGMVAGQFPVAASATTVTSSAMAWDAANQRLGIGTTGPGAPLHVLAAANRTITIVSNGSNAARFGADAGTAYLEGVDGTGTASFQPLTIGGTYVAFHNSNTEAMRITGGNVGINTAAPVSRLHVAGQATVGGTHPVNIGTGPNGADSTSNLVLFADYAQTIAIGSIYRTGTNQTGYGTTSDARLKDDITESQRGLDALMAIKVSDYRMGETSQQGLLAQQVSEHYPEAVREGGDDPDLEPWMIDYGRLTPLLIRSMQQQQAEIGRLSAKVVMLEARLGA